MRARPLPPAGGRPATANRAAWPACGPSASSSSAWWCQRGTGRPSRSCSRRWIWVASNRSAPRVTSVTPSPHRRAWRRGGRWRACQILAHQHDIAEPVGLHLLLARQVRRSRSAARCAAAPPSTSSRQAAASLHRRRIGLAGAGIDRAVGTRLRSPPRRFRRGCSCTDRAVPSPPASRPPPRIRASRVALRAHLVPFEAQPCEIGAEFVGQFGARARAVDILDPQQEPPAIARARDRARRSPNRHGRGAAGRWGWGQTGSRMVMRSRPAHPSRSQTRLAKIPVDSHFVTGLTLFGANALPDHVREGTETCSRPN